jgi:hypothetical protein
VHHIRREQSARQEHLEKLAQESSPGEVKAR